MEAVAFISFTKTKSPSPACQSRLFQRVTAPSYGRCGTEGTCVNTSQTKEQRASLLGARTLLGALLAILLVTRTLLVTKGKLIWRSDVEAYYIDTHAHNFGR